MREGRPGRSRLRRVQVTRWRFLTDAQLKTAKAACVHHGLRSVLWQYVYAKVPPRDEAAAFAETIRAFDPPFVFIDVEGEYERADSSVSGQYAEAFPHPPAAHPGCWFVRLHVRSREGRPTHRRWSGSVIWEGRWCGGVAWS